MFLCFYLFIVFKNYIMLLFCFIINFILFFLPYLFLFLGLSVRACVQYRGKHMVGGIVFYIHHLLFCTAYGRPAVLKEIDF